MFSDMFRVKLLIIVVFSVFFMLACTREKRNSFVIAESKKYEVSIYKQNCALCHGSEGEGKTLTDGKIVPSLRTGDFKFKTPEQIHKQISEGGNGMLPFNRTLSAREIQLMTDFVYNDLRGQ